MTHRNMTANCSSCLLMRQAEVRGRKALPTIGHMMRDAYDEGQRDALAAAVQRVEEIVVQSRWGTTSHGLIGKGEAIAAIKGEQA
jgi:hypothetical protein